MREQLEDEYGSDWKEPMFDKYPKAKIIASIDESESYETDQTAILRDGADGTFILATALGCSCWEGDWSLFRYSTLDELLDDIGPSGEYDYDYNPTFAGVEALRGQLEAANWLNAKGVVDDQC
jgi:hypothetical protein